MRYKYNKQTYYDTTSTHVTTVKVTEVAVTPWQKQTNKRDIINNQNTPLFSMLLFKKVIIYSKLMITIEIYNF